MFVLSARYGTQVHKAVPLRGGYDPWAESWCVRSDRGRLVVRADRSLSVATAVWVAEMTRRAQQAGVPCTSPLSAVDGAAAVAVGAHTLTVRRFVDGVELDRDDPTQLHRAGATLAVLHRALTGQLPERPSPSPWHEQYWSGEHDPPAMRDPELDAWQTSFTRPPNRSLTRGVVHGDFWSGNILCVAGQVAAVIDWTEARLDLQARELAWASWEFGHDPATRELNIDRTRMFLAGYRAVNGRWQPGLAESLIPLMRIELRLHARYALTNPGDHMYSDSLVREFVRLRSNPPVELLP